MIYPIVSQSRSVWTVVNPTILFTWRDGIGGFATTTDTEVTAGVYDNNLGGATAPTTALTTNNWVNHRIYYSPDANVTVIQYGQKSYNSSTAALTGYSTESFSRNPSFSGVPFRGIVTMRGGATNLTLATDAVFSNADRLGLL